MVRPANDVSWHKLAVRDLGLVQIGEHRGNHSQGSYCSEPFGRLPFPGVGAGEHGDELDYRIDLVLHVLRHVGMADPLEYVSLGE